MMSIRDVAPSRWFAAGTLLLLVGACGGDDDNAPTSGAGAGSAGGSDVGTGGAMTVDYGQYELSSASELCEGIDGLNGQAIIDHEFNGAFAPGQAKYVEPMDGTFTDDVSVTVALSWPADPVFTCYPLVEMNDLPFAQARLMMDLDMSFVSDDGAFDEQLAARAMLISTAQGQVNPPVFVAVRDREQLQGSYQLHPDFVSTIRWLVMSVSSNGASGNVSVSTSFEAAPITAGVILGGGAVLVWPTM